MGADVDAKPFKSGLVIDRLSRFDYPITDHAISIDEFAIVLNKETKHKIDSSLGWHLWATDLCLKSIRSENSLYAKIIRIALFHNSYNDGKLPDSFYNSAKHMTAKYSEYPVISTLCGNIGESNSFSP